MKQINLLPQSYRAKAASKRELPVLVVTAILAIAAVGGLWLIVNTEKVQVSNRLQTAQLAEQERQAREQKQQGGQPSADLLARVGEINTLSKTETDWSRFFAFLGALTPQDIRLSSFSFNQSGGSILKFTGDAPSNVSFAVFMESLRSSKLQTVKVESYSYNATKGTVSFTISGTVPGSNIVFAK